MYFKSLALLVSAALLLPLTFSAPHDSASHETSGIVRRNYYVSSNLICYVFCIKYAILTFSVGPTGRHGHDQGSSAERHHHLQPWRHGRDRTYARRDRQPLE